MLITTHLKPFRHGNHFRANALRGAASLIDPFLGVDHAWMSGPTFPMHHHEGMSAVSYLFLDSETSVDNHDSLGSRHLIRPGALHWTTAGSGIDHEGQPVETGKIVHSLQIFVDLAPERRNIDAFTLTLEPEDIPVVQTVDATVRIPVGGFGKTRSPLVPPTDVTLLDITVRPGRSLAIPIAAGERAFFLPISGMVTLEEESYDASDLRVPVYLAQETARHAMLHAPYGAQVMFFTGPSLQPRSR